MYMLLSKSATTIIYFLFNSSLFFFGFLTFFHFSNLVLFVISDLSIPFVIHSN